MRRLLLALGTLSLILAPIGPSAAAPSHAAAGHTASPRKKAPPPCSKAEAQAADKVLTDLAKALDADPTKRTAAMAEHLPWGEPAKGADEVRLVQANYVIDYDKKLRVPLWTAEHIVASSLDAKVPRRDCFRGDPRLDAPDSALPADYDEPLYDQGHMAPFADQRYNTVAGFNSFVMTNMTPQICELNRGIWQILEEITRRWAANRGDLYVFAGSVFDRDGDGRRDPDAAALHMRSRNGGERVAVPSAFYKVVAFRRAGGGVETLSFLLPHNQSNPVGDAAVAYLKAHITTLPAIEKLTGLHLFPAATGLQEDSDLWPFTNYKPTSLCHSGAKAKAKPKPGPHHGAA
ncbi:MAG: endonuclease mitochondrial [Sphingomonadales bacterium]|jgi:endonuclease G|nr:endonuclease mitochondrial [Sphingomonadales bacterium]